MYNRMHAIVCPMIAAAGYCVPQRSEQPLTKAIPQTVVDSAFGKVQEGSPISHQHPLPAGAYQLPVCVHSPTAATSKIAGNYFGYGEDNRGCYKRAEGLCGVTPCQEDEDHIFPLQGYLPCPRSEFSRTSCRENLKGSG
ncbi:hypothetical protein N1851_012325 [Merluccius polli]|uniref:Uncharacterized protein n=1 Tax=Merluccius polli TaxID=89951 RepID=A0AA47MWR0_MERPO|nr:hypothetical protein N1851_012325 [Merluccius polli]